MHDIMNQPKSQIMHDMFVLSMLYELMPLWIIYKVIKSIVYTICHITWYLIYVIHHIGLAYMYIIRHIRIYSIIHEYPEECC